MSPFLYQHHTYVSGKDAVQRSQLVVGLIYSFSLHSNQTSDNMFEHHFVVSRDRSKDFHIFKHMYVEFTPEQSVIHSKRSKEADTCGNQISLPLAALLDIPHQIITAISEVQSLRVASYNIWNVNSLPGGGEVYETRLQRLRKV